MDDEFTQYSKSNPPRNRKKTGLKNIEIEVVGRDKTTRLDPNGAILVVIELPKKGLPFGEPDEKYPSLLSGGPGYLYRTPEVEIALSSGELISLLARDLKPGQFKALSKHFGLFFEIHQDFYDEASGEALQPVRFRATLKPNLKSN
jgi:hypothetical protein